MSTLKIIALAAALGFGGATVAMAQSPTFNARHSGGSGTHASSVKTGSSANTQKVDRNQNGYRR